MEILFFPIIIILINKFSWTINQDLFIDMFIGRKSFEKYLKKYYDFKKL